MEIHRYIELPMVAIIAAMFAAACNWGATPDRLPVHWNLAGQPDRHGGRAQGLLLIPLITAASYVMMLALPLSNVAGVAALSKIWTVFRYGDVMLLAVVYCAMLANYRGVEFSMVKVVLIAARLLLVVVAAMASAAVRSAK